MKDALANYFSNLEKLSTVKNAVKKGRKIKEQTSKEVRKTLKSSKQIKVQVNGAQLHDLINKQDKEKILDFIKTKPKKYLEELDEFLF